MFWMKRKTSLQFYNWASTFSYFNNPSSYQEYPAMWMSISEKGLDSSQGDTYYPPYNITKEFAAIHKPGNVVYNSSSTVTDGEGIEQIASKDSSNYYVTIMNKDTDKINVSLSLTGGNSSSSTLVLGVIEGYGIKYLVIPFASSPQDQNNNENNGNNGYTNTPLNITPKNTIPSQINIPTPPSISISKGDLGDEDVDKLAEESRVSRWFWIILSLIITLGCIVLVLVIIIVIRKKKEALSRPLQNQI